MTAALSECPRPSTATAVLILEGERLLCDTLFGAVEALGSKAAVCHSVAELLLVLETSEPYAVMLDLASERFDDRLACLEAVRRARPSVKPIILADPAANLIDAYILRGAAAVLSRRDTSLAEVRAVLCSLNVPRAAEIVRREVRLASLSTREREALRLIAAGDDNLRIAVAMGITERTVRAHAAALYRKLEVENRAQLALLGRELDTALVH